jgi:hypothetical protein
MNADSWDSVDDWSKLNITIVNDDNEKCGNNKDNKTNDGSIIKVIDIIDNNNVTVSDIFSENSPKPKNKDKKRGLKPLSYYNNKQLQSKQTSTQIPTQTQAPTLTNKDILEQQIQSDMQISASTFGFD